MAVAGVEMLMGTDTVKVLSRRSYHRSTTSKNAAPAHKARVSRDCLITGHIDSLWWPGHSPEANAIEHAWPRIRRHVGQQFTSSCTENECEKQWVISWDAMPIDAINRWVDAILEQVQSIIRADGKQLPRVTYTAHNATKSSR